MTYSIPFLAVVSRPGIKDAFRASGELSDVMNSTNGVSSYAVDFVVPGKIFFTVSFDRKERFKDVLAKKLMSARLLDSIHLLGSVMSLETSCLDYTEVCSFKRKLKQMLNNVTFSNTVRQCIDLCKILCPHIPLNENRVAFKCKSRGIKRDGKTLVSSNDICKVIGTVLEEIFPDLEANIQSFDVCINVGTVRHKSENHTPSPSNGDLFYISIPIFVQSTKHNHGSWQVGRGLHPSICWAIAKCLKIQTSDVVLDPMCGRGNILIEMALLGLGGSFIGCEINKKRVHDAHVNLQRAVASSKVCLIQVDSSEQIPMPSASVDKIAVDLPFGKKFGSIEDNKSLYPKIFLEMARVCRLGGKALVLTSAENDKIIRSCFAKVFDTSSLPEGSSENENRIDCHHNALSNIWNFQWKFSFMLFSKIRARMYLLERTNIIDLPSTEKLLHESSTTYHALVQHEGARKKKYLGDPHWDKDKPSLFVQKLDVTSISRLPWDTENGSWSHQWKMGRAPMVLWT